MRILELTETLAAGGAETFVVRIANALAAAGHEVVLAVMLPNVHPAVAAAIDARVRIEHAPARGARTWWRMESLMRHIGSDARPLHRRQLRWLEGIVGSFSPDVIHSHLLKADLLAMDARLGDEVDSAHVLTVHGDYPMFLNGRTDPFLKDMECCVDAIANSADAIVGVAKPHLELFRDRFAVPNERLHLIYNGLDAPAADGPSLEALGLPDDRFLFGMVARGIEAKGWRQAIEAFRSLGRSDAALVLVGEGPFLDQLKAEGQPKEVIFAGFAANPVDWIRHFNCGLLPSFYGAESLPTVIIEYLACGKPVIATDIGEVAAMLRAPDGSMAGQLVPQREVDHLAAAMRNILEDPALRESQSSAAPRAFAKFAMSLCRERYERLFEVVVNSSSKSARH